MSLKEEFGIDAEIIAEAFNKGFWFKEKESFMTPAEMERFRWKNSELYDAEHKLIFQPGLAADTDRVIHAKAALGVMKLDGEKIYYFSTMAGNAGLLLKDFKKTWAINKEDLIKKGRKK